MAHEAAQADAADERRKRKLATELESAPESERLGLSGAQAASDPGSPSQRLNGTTVLGIQRTMGNRAFQRIMATRSVAGPSPRSSAVSRAALRSDEAPETDAFEQPITAPSLLAQAADAPPDESPSEERQSALAQGAIRRQSATAAGGIIQRAPPSVDDRLTALEGQQAEAAKQQRATAKQNEAMIQDLKWKALINGDLSRYRQAIYRISGAMNKAVGSFTAAQTAQIQINAMFNQCVALFATVAFAAAFEPAMGIVGAKIGKAEADIKSFKKFVEGLENPANAAASGAGNVATTAAGVSDANKGQVPGGAGGPGADAMGYLTQNLELIEKKSESMEASFLARAIEMRTMTVAEWEKFDAAKVEREWQGLEATLKDGLPSVDKLKSADEVALIIERHLWAARLRQVVYHGQIELGTEIEAHLNLIGVSKEADVTLTGHWYSPNSWHDKLGLWRWAWKYDKKIHDE